MKKIISIFLSCCFLCTLLASCSGESSSDRSSAGNTDSEIKTTSLDQSSKSDIGDEETDTTQSQVTGNTDIAADRLNDDYDSLEKEASALFKKYYDGIEKDDYKTFSAVFPDFYLNALEEEGKEYNQTNEEFLKSINETNKSTYGDDFYSFATITAILQLTDESLDTLNSSIKDTFGTKKKIEDAYSVYMTQTIRGSVSKDSMDMNYIMVIIDGKYYLYDEYFAYKQ